VETPKRQTLHVFRHHVAILSEIVQVRYVLRFTIPCEGFGPIGIGCQVSQTWDSGAAIESGDTTHIKVAQALADKLGVQVQIMHEMQSSLHKVTVDPRQQLMALPVPLNWDEK
jgi:hypothetical protein